MTEKAPTLERQKQVRTPRSAESILKGALALSLADQVSLVKELKAAIQAKVTDAEAAAKAAKETVDGL